MAFPSVVGTLGGGDAANGTTRNFTWPTVSGGILSTDVGLIVASCDATPTVTWPDASYVVLQDAAAASTTAKLVVVYRRMAGGESGTFAVGTGASEAMAWRLRIIRGVHATSAPEISVGATFTSIQAPDPDALTPSWGAEDTLWVAVEAHDGSVTTTGWPTNYTGDQTSDTGSVTAASRSGTGSAIRNLNATSDDPGVFATSAGEESRAATLAIRPAAGAAPAELPILIVPTLWWRR